MYVTFKVETNVLQFYSAITGNFKHSYSHHCYIDTAKYIYIQKTIRVMSNLTEKKTVYLQKQLLSIYSFFFLVACFAHSC